MFDSASFVEAVENSMVFSEYWFRALQLNSEKIAA